MSDCKKCKCHVNKDGSCGCLTRPAKLQWDVYPAGADLILLDGALHICVCRDGEKWAAVVSVGLAAGGGALVLGEGSRSKEAAINAAEKWLRDHVAAGLPATKRRDRVA